MLVYTTDQSAGIERKGAGKGFYYLDADGAKVEDEATLSRINSLAIPPAYTDVWICPLDNGHLQATGRDQRKRKQYRYHPQWQELRNLDKFDKLVEVGEGLPRLRRKVRRHLSDFEGTREQVVASAVRVIDRLGLRIGNERYLKDNQTRGVSTLTRSNINLVDDSVIEIEYTAKGGKKIESRLKDALTAQAVSDCHELGGQRLFSYKDQSDEIRHIDSDDINQYLSETFGSQVSAKDLRTWRASAEAVDFLRKIKRPDDRKAEIRDAIHHAAGEIHNRYATCRKHYVHPKILEAYESSSTAGFSRLQIPERPEMQQAEALLLRILNRKLTVQK